VLYDTGRRKKALVVIRKGPQGTSPILVGEREVASLNPVVLGKEVLSQRAFSFIKPDINAQETQLFLSVAILRMVQSVMETK
jgi:hypothetical protein